MSQQTFQNRPHRLKNRQHSQTSSLIWKSTRIEMQKIQRNKSILQTITIWLPISYQIWWARTKSHKMNRSSKNHTSQTIKEAICRTFQNKTQSTFRCTTAASITCQMWTQCRFKYLQNLVPKWSLNKFKRFHMWIEVQSWSRSWWRIFPRCWTSRNSCQYEYKVASIFLV